MDNQAAKDCRSSKPGRLVRALLADRHGGALVEYAFVGPFFIALVTGIFYIGMTYLGQAGLETVAEGASRMLLTGRAQTVTVTNAGGGTDVGMTAADFKNAICNGMTGTDTTGATVTFTRLLPPFLTCSRLTVNVTPVNYSQASLGQTYSGVYVTQNGGQGQNQIMMVQLLYDWPTFGGLMGLNLATQGNGTRRMIASSVFTTEAYSCATGQTSC